MNRICTTCGIEKALVEFKDPSEKRRNMTCEECTMKKVCIGCPAIKRDCRFVGRRCITCHNTYQRDRIKLKPNFVKNIEVICVDCGFLKKASQFVVSKGSKNGIAGRCKSCHNVKKNIYMSKQKQCLPSQVMESDACYVC